MPVRGETFVSGGTIADLTNAYQVAALTGGTGLASVPDHGVLGLLEVSMAVGDATTTSITVKLTRDLAGDILLAGPTTVVPEPGQTATTTYSIVVDYQRIPYDRGNIGVSGTIYAWVKAAAVPAGTQLTTIRLHGEYR